MLRSLYNKLLTWYPRAFQDQMGESMRQTVDDVWRERLQQKATARFRFVIWLFLETATGAAREHILVLKQERAMSTRTRTFKFAALISSLLVLPLVMLELLNNAAARPASTGFIVLFGALWLMPATLVVAAMPVLRSLRTSGHTGVGAVSLVARIALSALLIFAWGSLVIDQMPCFLGVPNCD